MFHPIHRLSPRVGGLVGFGPGYNVMGGLTTAKDKTVLLLSKPTANLHGDSSGKRPDCARYEIHYPTGI